MHRHTDMHKGHADTKTCTDLGTHIQTHSYIQTNIHKGSQMHRYTRHTERQIHKLIHTEHTYMYTDKWTQRLTDAQIYKTHTWGHIKTYKQTHRLKDIHVDPQHTEKHTNTL